MRRGLATAALAALLLVGCGGGGGGDSTGDDGSTFAGLTPFPALERLTAAETARVVGLAVAEAQAQGAPATIAVVDRVGNVLAVFEMTGAPRDMRAVGLSSAAGSGLDGLTVPDGARLGAIAKAVTGAYLSSSGNAFSTRTASQIVQENFNPGERGQPGGPLFGVQFSQLPCSDLSTRFASTGAAAGGTTGSTVGPKRSPLGLSADPGGLPLYKNGVVVGGIGVIADGIYGLDRDPRDRDSAAQRIDELIALGGTRGFLPSQSIVADRITVEGKSLRYTDGGLDDDLDDLASDPRAAPGLSGLAAFGVFRDVTGYYDDASGALAGVAYGDTESGYVPASTVPGSTFGNASAFVLVDQAGEPRYPPIAARDAPGGSAGNRLTATEVRRLLDEGLGVALAGRAQIRRPIDSRIQVTVSVVDTTGDVLGVARTPDAPIFGTDVSLQKARSAMFLSSPGAGAALADVPGATANVGAQIITIPPLSTYVTATDDFLNRTAFGGAIAYSARGIGNLARPFYPDGINGNGPGPLSRRFAGPDTTTSWSPFSTGLQFDLIGGNILGNVFYALGASTEDTALGCTGLAPTRPASFPLPPLANGLQIFAGGVPIYRGGLLVGAIGVSGDGIDQDDMVASLALSRTAAALGGIGHAPADARSDRLKPEGVRLRYVSCPFTPFLGSDAQNVCEDL